MNFAKHENKFTNIYGNQEFIKMHEQFKTWKLRSYT